MTDTTDERLPFPREIWMGDRYEHDQGMLHVRAAQDEDHDHRYVDADIYESAEKYWRTRAEDAEAKLAVAREALVQCRDEIDDYIKHEYPGDHPVQDRYRKRDMAANPARVALATLDADTTPAPEVSVGKAQQRFNAASVDVLRYGATICRLQELDAAWEALRALAGDTDHD